MNEKNSNTVAVIALGTSEKEQSKKQELEKSVMGFGEIELCQSRPNKALQILRECRGAGKIATFYTDYEVAYKYSNDPKAFIHAAAQLSSNFNVYII